MYYIPWQSKVICCVVKGCQKVSKIYDSKKKKGERILLDHPHTLMKTVG